MIGTGNLFKVVMPCILEDYLQLPLYYTSIGPNYLLQVLEPTDEDSSYTKFKDRQLENSSLAALSRAQLTGTSSASF